VIINKINPSKKSNLFLLSSSYIPSSSSKGKPNISKLQKDKPALVRLQQVNFSKEHGELDSQAQVYQAS
jgi:hypothetical protein